MLSMAAQLEIYEEMHALSEMMVAAARAKDWERLVGLEKSVAALRNTLASHGEDIAGAGPDELERKAHLIRDILEDDAEVRRHTEPWMEQVKQFLGDATRKRQVERAYSAV